ncbi:MAG TPA: tripartite tricarboxylate transporter substrate binding protein [Xanthobacteraceae bacterium]|nr:tripartite tricarboxylate transporter substrate binding protein [Xanthobacteraceae bacterium]
MRTDRRCLIAGTLALGVAGMTSARAQTAYPNRPVRVIVPFAPGGVTDVVARLISGKISEQFGKQFYVENVVGGSGNVGMGQAARAAPDGYSMLTAFSSFVINPAMFERVPYDPVNDFNPVALAVTSTTVIVVNAELPVSNITELVALIRANPGKYSYASAGTGTTSHLAGEQFRLALALDLVHVPFSGGAPAMAAVVAGHTPIGMGTPTVAVPLVNDGKLSAIAVTSKTRTQTLPQVPTMAESGYRDIEGDSFVGFVVPAGTPKDIITLLNGEIVKSLATADMKERQAALGNDVVASTPEEFGHRLRAELAIWAKVIKAANIKAG